MIHCRSAGGLCDPSSLRFIANSTNLDDAPDCVGHEHPGLIFCPLGVLKHKDMEYLGQVENATSVRYHCLMEVRSFVL